jgi:adenylate cyclase
MLWAALVAVLAALAVHAHRTRRRATALGERLAAATRSLEQLQRAFGSFAPAEVVEDIIARGVSTRSEKKEITVLFADLKGFTVLSDRLDPEVLVQVLNGYFARMSRAISNHRGHTAKLLGDGLLAFFGALEANPWQTDDAAHAALAMRDALTEYNLTLARDGLPALAMGVGIHRGPVVAGVIGSADLVEYGVIGQTVNLAARVEDLTRLHDVDILVTEGARGALDPRFRLRAMPAAEVKGMTDAVRTFVVESFDGTS